ncbi:hypothetical protein RND61_09915 [Streptomyces sp. TRM76323]|uniref:Uncharacterized protein n=1 Tax=Streptomyces tamarix TaxID=3078565 RepID=A0ABU3QI01_9ACTN|nr:hypothetical protein [Streptomyces tamarix]MDT9682383.1 hypothetical protein [Streptomyces tamarix]
MSALDFYAHVATRRDVLGAGAGAHPDRWEAALGRGFLDVPGDGLLRRDYGLVEINFAPDPRGRMSCFGFGIEIHRLLHDRSPSAVPVPLSRHYGEFAPRVPFGELQAAVSALGRTAELDDVSRDMHRYRVSGSGARIHVIVDPGPHGSDDPGPAGHRAGDVWSIDVW